MSVSAGEISFKVSRHDAAIIDKIVSRTMIIYEQMNAPPLFRDRMSIKMDITACHANGNPLRLEKLLAADDFNFCHDVFGIRDHLDRDDASPTGGQLLHFFRPRCSVPETSWETA